MSEIIRFPSAHREMWKSLADKAYRRAYAAAHVGDYLAMQVHSMRARLGWTQKRLADESGIAQPQISNYETSCEGVNLTTLHRLADAFDVALLVKFVPFSQLARETISARADSVVPSFDSDSEAAISYPETTLVPQHLPRHGTRLSITGSQGYMRQIDVGASEDRAVTAT